jgi:hypothetical protein
MGFKDTKTKKPSSPLLQLKRSTDEVCSISLLLPERERIITESTVSVR